MASQQAIGMANRFRIWQQVRRGKTAAQIASELSLHPETVLAHWRSLRSVPRPQHGGQLRRELDSVDFLTGNGRRGWVTVADAVPDDCW